MYLYSWLQSNYCDIHRKVQRHNNLHLDPGDINLTHRLLPIIWKIICLHIFCNSHNNIFHTFYGNFYIILMNENEQTSL